MQGHSWASGIAHLSGSRETPGEGCQVRAGALQNRADDWPRAQRGRWSLAVECVIKLPKREDESFGHADGAGSSMHSVSAIPILS